MRIVLLAMIMTAACLWHGAARAADAVDTPITHDPWIVQRQIFLQNMMNNEDHNILERRTAYREGVKDNAKPWWDKWLSDIPYDKGLTYTTPSAQMIDTTPVIIHSVDMAATPAGPAPADANGLPNGPSEANRSTGPVEPLPADQILGK